MNKIVHVIGGGLSGVEVAWQCLRADISVVLHEMRPVQMTPAHKTSHFAELVCSNSLKTLQKESAPGLLKEEMQAFDSLVLKKAYEHQVPAGQALAVERVLFSEAITNFLQGQGKLTIAYEEVTTLPKEEELIQRDEYWVVATGPLTSELLSKELVELAGEKNLLNFYDAISPILATDSIDMEKAFIADRWDKGEGDGDYINVPLDKETYEKFIANIESSQKVPLHSFEKIKYFEACLPVEVMVARGKDTLRFGPLKPVGLFDPKDGKTPHAVIQLRAENASKTMYSLVGFQTKMTWPEQKRVLSEIPALKDAEFLRYGSVHRNTYFHSPKVLNRDFSFKNNSRIFLAGQLTGVEGYTESAAIGIAVGRIVRDICLGKQPSIPPKESVIGALCHYVLEGGSADFSPMNANFGLLGSSGYNAELGRKLSKAEKKSATCAVAARAFHEYIALEN